MALPAILGARFRELRNGLGLTQSQAGQAIHFSASKISRLESGLCRSYHAEDVDALLSLYGVSTQDRSKYLAWAHQVNASCSPDHDGAEYSPRFDILMDLEPVDVVRQYEQAVIPELLQTAEYARAALRLAHLDLSDDDIERVLDERRLGQKALCRNDPPQLWILIEYEALRRPIGGAGVLKRQIDHLLAVIEKPNVTVQVIEGHVCGPAVVRHAFMCLRFANRELPDLICVQQVTGTTYFNLPAETERYRKAADLLSALAAPPARTPQFLLELRDDLAPLTTGPLPPMKERLPL